MGDIFGDDVEAGDIESDDAGGEDRLGGILGMHFGGAVGGEVTDGLNEYFLSEWWNGFGSVVLFSEFDECGVIEHHSTQWVGVIASAAWVEVEGGDKLLDVAFAIAVHVFTFRSSGRD